MTYTKIKSIVALVLVTIVLLTASGCGDAKKVNTTDLSEEILTLTTFSELKELSGASLPSYFRFSDGSVKRFNVRISATGESADTLACFEVKDKEQRTTAIKGISQYLSDLSTFFKPTMESEYQKVENRLLVELDDVIVLVICNDIETVWNYLASLGAKEVI